MLLERLQSPSAAGDSSCLSSVSFGHHWVSLALWKGIHKRCILRGALSNSFDEH